MELARKHFAKTIEINGIDLRLNVPDTPVNAEISIDEMNKVMHHLISNSIYAVSKKLQKQNFSPEIVIRVIPLASSSRSSPPNPPQRPQAPVSICAAR